jgi:hypothetical protein
MPEITPNPYMHPNAQKVKLGVPLMPEITPNPWHACK